MTVTYQRYSVAWTPSPTSPLARFGAEWFGWCAERGERRDQIRITGLPAGLTKGLRVGCLQAPLVAPFSTASESDVCFALEAQLAAVAERTAQVPVSPLEVVHRPTGLALAPSVPNVGIARVLRDVAAALGNRAPMPEFCLPLTVELDPVQAEIVSAKLTCLLRPELRRGHAMSEITLLGYPGAGERPVVLRRFELTGGARRRPYDSFSAEGPDVLFVDDYRRPA